MTRICDRTRGNVQKIRPIHRRGPDRPGRLEAGVADDAAERDRGSAGDHRSRDGRSFRRLHGQCGHRRQLADHPRRHRLHQLALHRHGRAGGAVRRSQRAGQGQPGRLPGVPDRVRPVDHPGRGRVLRGAISARSCQCRAQRAGGGASVPARDVHGHLRHDDVLHAQWRVSRRGRPADAASARRHDDGPHDCLQRHPDSDVRHDRRGARHDCEQHPRGDLRLVEDRAARLRHPLRARYGQAAGFHHHPLAVPLWPAHWRSGHRHERRRRADVAVHRLASSTARPRKPLTRSDTPSSSR